MRGRMKSSLCDKSTSKNAPTWVTGSKRLDFTKKTFFKSNLRLKRSVWTFQKRWKSRLKRVLIIWRRRFPILKSDCGSQTKTTICCENSFLIAVRRHLLVRATNLQPGRAILILARLYFPVCQLFHLCRQASRPTRFIINHLLHCQGQLLYPNEVQQVSYQLKF